MFWAHRKIDHIIKGKLYKRNNRKMAIAWTFSCNSFVKFHFHGKDIWEPEHDCREPSGSVVDCLTRDRGTAGSNLTNVNALCPCLELVQPRKTSPDITEKLLGGCKE